MDSDRPQASTAQGSEDLFPGAPVHVRLPFMGPSANAWAQQKERELQQRMQQQSSYSKEGKENVPVHHKQSTAERLSDAVAIPLVGPTMPASQKLGARSSGLDYDEELALPMPKPRTLSRPSPPSPLVISTQPAGRRGRKGKDRSATDPGNATMLHSMLPVPETPSEDKKLVEKRSRVATLKSKFSIKDMIKESSKDASKAATRSVENDTVLQSKPSVEYEKPDGKPDDTMGEPRMYFPKPKISGVFPSSAPPISVPDRFGDSSSSIEEPRIRTVRSTPAAAVNSLVERPKGASVGSVSTTETPQTKYVSPQEKVEGMIMGDPSLSPTRTGTYAKSGNPEFVRSQTRIVSMQAEVEPVRQESGESSSSQIQISGLSTEVVYSPSVYGVSTGGAWEQLQHAHPDTMPMFSPAHPPPAENNDHEHFRYRSETIIPANFPIEQSFSVQHPANNQRDSGNFVISTPIPGQHEPSPQPSQYPNTSIDETALFSGVTSHGGYAPPPPDPEYQSTASLEQQLWTHVSTLHHHMNNMSARITKVVGDTNNWHMDQVLRNVENLGDVARILTNRAVGHTQIANETRQLLIDVRGELQALRRETSITDRHLSETVHNFQKEIIPLRRKIDTLYAEFMTHSSAEAKGKKRMERIPSEEEISARLSNTSVASGSARDGGDIKHSKVGEPSAATEECPSNVPTPTAAFRTPPNRGNTKGEENIETVKGKIKQHHQDVHEELTGSPSRKAALLHSQSDHASACSALSGPKFQGSDENNNVVIGDKAKTSRKKNVFGLGKRRDGEPSKYPKTPRRNKVSDQGPPHQLSVASLSSPHIPQTPSRMSSEGTSTLGPYVSPSSVHPALRNPRQQQVMREREQQSRNQQRQRGSHRRLHQQIQSGFQSHHQSYVMSPSFPPNSAASNPYISYPPMFTSPTMPSMPGYHPPPPPPMPPRSAPGPHYGPPPAWVTGTPAPVMPGPSAPEPWGPSQWYQEAYGDERAGGNQLCQK